MTTKGHSSPGRPPIDPDVARFAAALRAEEQAKADAARAEADERRRQAEEQARHDRHGELRSAKDAAAARLREVRRAGRSDAVAQAETAYRDALAALVAFETGERPAWAPGTTETTGAPADNDTGAPTGDDTDAPAGGPTEEEPA